MFLLALKYFIIFNMETYEEFKKFKRIDGDKYPYLQEFELDDGSIFFIEPTFYTQLVGMKAHHQDKFDKIMEKLLSIVRKNKKVIFTGDYEFPYIELDGFIYQEITDITDPLLIFVEDKSRGSDYGD